MAKTFVGGGKKKSPTWLKINLDLDKLIQNAYEYNGKKYVKLDINVKDEPDQYGKDVQVTVDDFDPKKGAGQQPTQVSAPTYPKGQAPSQDFVDDLPF